MLMPSIFKNDFSELFDDDVRFPFKFPVIPSRPSHPIMKTDIKEIEGGTELTMDLPGFAKEDIKAELKDGIMTISAERKEEKDEKDDKGNYIKRERYFGSCKRSFMVGEDITEKDIKAKFKNGILTIVVPKKEEPEKEEKNLIEIK